MTNIIPETSADYERTRITERPDGFYWQNKETAEEYGPFATLLEAVQDMQSATEMEFGPGETLEEAESEIGISDWIDPDSGELTEEERPHIRDDH